MVKSELRRKDMKIDHVEAIPLTVALKRPQVTAQESYTKISICLVRVRTDGGIEGVGECLARFGPGAHAHLINEEFRPLLVGKDPFSIRDHWRRMRNVLNGRSGGVLFEAIAGVDIALWDILGKAHGTNVGRLLGGMNRDRVPVYASSIMVDDDEVEAGENLVAQGFSRIKIKIGGNAAHEAKRVRNLRSRVGEEIDILVDANYVYYEEEAAYLSRALAECGVTWFEEPINPENREGYKRLASISPTPLAAGESEYTAHDFVDKMRDGTVKFVQPDVTRAGGISESYRIATVADAHHLRFAPHVGFSGIVCTGATLQLACAAPNLYAAECMVTPNPFRDDIGATPVGLASQTKDGYAEVPTSPGIGVEIDWKAVERMRSQEN